MDKVKIIFDKWANSGRSELMEKEHSKTVSKFLDSVSFQKQFSFLDVGCGNGWVIRKISEKNNCKKAIGIDKSKNMIKIARLKKNSEKEYYFQTDIQTWKYKNRFDYIFSMESLYYVESIELSLKKIYQLLKPHGQFFCGTDYYKENKATARWSKQLNLLMHSHSKSEWKKLFADAGFKTTTKQVKDLTNRKKWKREYGTLFIIGKK